MGEKEELPDRKPRGSRTPTDYAIATFSRVSPFWTSRAQNREDKEHSLFTIFNEMWNDESTSGDDIEEQLHDLLTNPDDEPLFLDPYVVLIACAYCVQAMKADASGQRELAWTYAVDARWWGGLTRGLDIEGDFGRGSSREQARKAAMARHKENHQMKRQVLDWFKDHKDEFSSKDAAAEAIAGTIVPVTFRTARNWLKEPPKK